MKCVECKAYRDYYMCAYASVIQLLIIRAVLLQVPWRMGKKGSRRQQFGPALAEDVHLIGQSIGADVRHPLRLGT